MWGERSFLVNSAEKTAARYAVMRARLGKHNTKNTDEGGEISP